MKKAIIVAGAIVILILGVVLYVNSRKKNAENAEKYDGPKVQEIVDQKKKDRKEYQERVENSKQICMNRCSADFSCYHKCMTDHLYSDKER